MLALSKPFSVEQPRLAAASRVDVAFDMVIDWLSTTFVCQDMSPAFSERTVTCLEKRFGPMRLVRVGSSEAETHVFGLSGTDYFCVLDRVDETHSSHQWLTAMARELKATFRSTENIHATERSVRVPFSGGRERVVFIPAIYNGPGLDTRPTYLIPDGHGRWQAASPESHRHRLAQIDARRGCKLKNLIRLAKLWKARAGIEINSYYVECFAASLFERMPAGIYSYSLSQLLLAMLKSDLKEMIVTQARTPQLAVAAPSKEAELIARTKLQRSSELACDAVLQERHGNVGAAFAKWSTVFRGAFPRHSFASS